MKKRFAPITAFLVLTLAALACASPLGGGGAPSSPDEVATIVASTLQALTPASSPATGAPPVEGGSSEPAPATIAAPGVLPRSFYFLGRDASGITQVFRIERDGVTRRQLTYEPSEVKSYDVSPVDGSIAYTANNQLLWADANGAGRRVLVEGGPVDINNTWETSVTNPVFTPNGQVIAYGLRGINLYTLASSSSALVLPTNPGDIAFGQPPEMYIPKHYSPDGAKLLITVAIPNSDGISAGIFFPGSGSLVRISGEGAIFCCGKQGWTSDSSALYAASPTLGMFGSGLWRVDAATGAINTVIAADAGGGIYNLPDEPYLAPDGQLYYFFAAAPSPDGFIQRGPLQITRSAIDGVTGRTVLLPDNFQLMNEALWAPDASFVIVAFAPSDTVYSGGQAEVKYLDGRPSLILSTFAQDLKWGP